MKNAGTSVDISRGVAIEVIETLYYFDQPLIFVGAVSAPIEATSPNIFILEDDDVRSVTYLASTVSADEIAAIKEDRLPIRDAFQRDGALLLTCGCDGTVARARVFRTAGEIPDDMLSEAGVMLHPPERNV